MPNLIDEPTSISIFNQVTQLLAALGPGLAGAIAVYLWNADRRRDVSKEQTIKINLIRSIQFALIDLDKQNRSILSFCDIGLESEITSLGVSTKEEFSYDNAHFTHDDALISSFIHQIVLSGALRDPYYSAAHLNAETNMMLHTAIRRAHQLNGILTPLPNSTISREEVLRLQHMVRVASRELDDAVVGALKAVREELNAIGITQENS